MATLPHRAGLVLAWLFIATASPQAGASSSPVLGSCLPLAHLIGGVVQKGGATTVVTRAALEAACNDGRDYPPKGTVPIKVDGVTVLAAPSDDEAMIKSLSAKNHQILDHLLSPASGSLTGGSWGADLSTSLQEYEAACTVGLAAPYDLTASLYFFFKGASTSRYCAELSTVLAVNGIRLVNGNDKGKVTAEAVSAFLHSKDRSVMAFTRGVQPASAYSARVLFSVGADSPCALPIAVVLHARGVPYFVPRDTSSYGLLEGWERLRTLSLLPGAYYIAPVRVTGARTPVPIATFRLYPNTYSYLGELNLSGSCGSGDPHIEVRNEFERDVKSAEREYGDKETMARFKINLMKVSGTIPNNMPLLSSGKY